MDNPLTPNKIQRLIRLAEDKSFGASRRLHMVYENDEYADQNGPQPQNDNKSTGKYESSSGILDLENIVAFGESGAGCLSIGNSTGFNPNEMSGRSTGASEVNSKKVVDPQFERCGRHSMVIENLTNELNKQTEEINDLLRHSIASNYTFNSKPNLTADEASLVMREAPLPVMPSAMQSIPDNSLNTSSVSQYFMKRCQDLKKILGNVESPDKYMKPSITEVSSSTRYDTSQQKLKNDRYDENLDCVPVRQPRNINPTLPATAVEPKTVSKPTANIVSNTSTVSKTNQIQPDTNIYQMGITTEEFLNKMNSFAITNDVSESMDSFSLSRIAEYLGKQSRIRVSDMLKLHDKKERNKQPLVELNMNKQDTRKPNQVQVTYVKDSRNLDTASSSTMNTLGSLKENIERAPAVVLTRPSTGNELTSVGSESVKTDAKTVRSKSPLSKSQSTLSTVQENYSSFRSGSSPLNTSKGVSNSPHVLSANLEYKELDKSVDWREVMQQKRLMQRSLAKDRWADILVSPVDGYIGARNVVDISVTTLTETWLTGKISFDVPPQHQNDITIELPRLPLLLSPGKTEKFSFFITCNVQIDTSLSFKMSLKDASIESDLDQIGSLDIKIKMPSVQAMSSDGLNKLSFPPLQERMCLTKSLILINDCTVDLQLDLSIIEGDSMFSIKSVREIRKSDINKILLDRQGSEDDQQSGRIKSKVLNKQLCRVTAGNAIKVAINFTAPKLSEHQLPDYTVSFQGVLHVNLIGVNCVIKKVDLIGTVGMVNLCVKSTENKIQLSHEITNLEVSNSGSIAGSWTVNLKHAVLSTETLPFKVSPSTFELSPGSVKCISLTYTGQPDMVTDAFLVFEETLSGNVTRIEITGGSTPKSFPIKTNHNTMSWVQVGRKEISLKNTMEKKIYIRCQIVGEGFTIDSPGLDSRGACYMSLGPFECKPLGVVFSPNNGIPQAASLHLVVDKNSEFSRKINLYGCANGESVCWSGLVTYGETALVRAVYAAPVHLTLVNRSRAPAFVAVTVHFNLQYSSSCGESCVSGARRVVAARGSHAVGVAPSWARVAARARSPHAPRALAALSVLTGPETTRRRILRVLKDEKTGVLDLSLLPEHLRVLADRFEGEDPSIDISLENFRETKASLNELIGGLQELSAQIDLPPDLSDENTIIATDDTTIDYHTICE